MCMRKFVAAAAVAALAMSAGIAAAESPHLGKPIAPSDFAAWDLNVLPDGTNLPPGGGKAAEGQKIFAEKCAACHGEKGEGGLAARVIGGPPKATLDGGKVIANYYPYATTVFDFIRRSMPWNAPRTLTDHEVYALTAYLLAANKLIAEDEEMNATTLPKVKMPNRDNFVVWFPDRI
jgi:S-disulfanyl-L-cysteine oxidoreductase SoxD